MPRIVETIEVNAPLPVVYEQWARFEEFDEFMQGILEVRRLPNNQLLWRAQIGGQEETWTAEIIEQDPYQRIAWRSTSGVQNDGLVTFDPVDADTTRVTLLLEYDPDSPLEKLGTALGMVEERVAGDLRRFKQFVESRGAEMGTWRGSQPGTSPR